MKFEGRWAIAILAVIAVVGISGFIEAMPQSDIPVRYLIQDAAILAVTISICVLLARKFGTRGKAVK